MEKNTDPKNQTMEDFLAHRVATGYAIADSNTTGVYRKWTGPRNCWRLDPQWVVNAALSGNGSMDVLKTSLETANAEL